MKKRQDFVSNSSSSSFIIYKRDLDGGQIEAIKNHVEYAEEYLFNTHYGDTEDRWSISEDMQTIKGSTWMDNFNMYQFMEDIDIPMDKVKWSD